MKDIFKIAFVMALFCISCQKELSIDKLDNFKIEINGDKFNINDSVTLKFEGEVDYIYLYTGEVGSDYDFKDGRIADVSDINLSFSSARAIGTQNNQFSVLISNDFNGDYTSLNEISQYTWSDITSEFSLATNSNTLTSGVVDLTSYKEQGKPVYIAYKYITKPQLTNGLGATWTITLFNFKGVTNYGEITIANMFNSGFRIVDPFKDTAPAQSTITTTRFTFLSNEYDDNFDPETEHWAISKAINVDKFDMGGDKAKAIKQLETSGIKEYTYFYSKPGNYTVYVIAKNQNIYKQAEIVKKFEIVVE